MPDTKKKTGRPSKFDGIDLIQVKALANKGWTDKEMAKFFDVNVSNWNEWKKTKQVFRESLKDWKDEADARVERSLYERATGYSHPDIQFAMHQGIITDEKEYIKHYAPDTTAAIFWLKNRDKENWRDKQDVEHSGSIDLTGKSDSELEAIINGQKDT